MEKTLPKKKKKRLHFYVHFYGADELDATGLKESERNVCKFSHKSRFLCFLCRIVVSLLSCCFALLLLLAPEFLEDL